MCGSLADEAKCNAAFDVPRDGTYRPCRWVSETLSCEGNGQELDCDCFLLHKGCSRSGKPKAPAPDSSAGYSTAQLAVMLIASVIMGAGCSALCWFCYSLRSHSSRAISRLADTGPEQAEDQEAEMTEVAPKKGRKGAKKVGAANQSNGSNPESHHPSAC